MPSRCPTLPVVLAESYSYIRKRASLETRLPLSTFPSVCPWGLAQIMDDDFWPEAPDRPRD